jgi:ferredoxin-NADP reductase
MSSLEQRLPWLLATVAELRRETPLAKTIALDVPSWPGHLAGQHIDLRLTAEDGYSAQRSYSLASPPQPGSRIEVTVQSVENGEVSSFLLTELRVGDQFELRGPIGGYFTWLPASRAPLMLIAGGSGVVPLVAMLRARRAQQLPTPAHLLYSSRTAEQILFRTELEGLAATPAGPTVVHTLTRETPADWIGEYGRIDRSMLQRRAIDPAMQPDVFVCGPTPFVETVAESLLTLGHLEAKVRTERFGPTGEMQ